MYTGANFIESKGRLTVLSKLSDVVRKGIGARLLSEPGLKVWRHLKDGDCMLVNRQVSSSTLLNIITPLAFK
jgi:hypothetical protein